MPELPDLEYVVGRLQKEVVGRTINEVLVKQPGVLKVPRQHFAEICTGQKLEHVERVGHFVLWSVGQTHRLVMHLMLAGRFQLAKPTAPKPFEWCWAFTLSDGNELRYLDDRTMGRAYLVTRAQTDTVPGLATLGRPVLSDTFSLEYFRKTIDGRRDMVRNFLLDKEAIASIGNAYADEILFDAKLHPKIKCNTLTAPEVQTLYESVGKVLRAAVAEVARRQEPIEVKVRDFLKVRKRTGKPCPTCKTPIAMVKMGSAEANFCPKCQPAR
jgi:formamidopyrimidine-DNA glycosylase